MTVFVTGCSAVADLGVNQPRAVIDGELDCSTDAGWAEMGEIDPDTQGDDTAAEALRNALQPFIDRHGGQFNVHAGNNAGNNAGNKASLIIDGREQMTASALQLENGTWVVEIISGCEGFER